MSYYMTHTTLRRSAIRSRSIPGLAPQSKKTVELRALFHRSRCDSHDPLQAAKSLHPMPVLILAVELPLPAHVLADEASPPIVAAVVLPA